MSARIRTSREALKEFCQRHHIRKLAFFGSVLREDFTRESDVDVLVEFQPGAMVGLITLAGIERELSSLLGRRADLHTTGGLNPLFRDSILDEAEVQYEQA